MIEHNNKNNKLDAAYCKFVKKYFLTGFIKIYKLRVMFFKVVDTLT